MKYNFDNYLANIPQRSLKFDAIKATKSNDFENYLSMGVADMSFKPPQEVLNVIKKEIQAGFLGYYGGIESYKQEVVNWLKTRHNWKAKPEWINTAHGLVAAIGTILRAFTSETDEVIIFSPVYHSFRKIIKANNRVLIESKMIKKNERYYLDLNSLSNKMNGNERILILCSPHNPSGRIWSKNELKEISYFCKNNKLILVIDEIHNDLIYPGKQHTLFPLIGDDFFKDYILMTSTTKTFNLAGGLMGNVIIPNDSLRAKFQKENLATGETPNRFGMILGEEAMKSGHNWLNELINYLKKNRDFFDKEINNLKTLKSMQLDSTYLAWVDFSKTGEAESTNFKKLSYDLKIISNPGSSFGSGGYNFFRFNLATSNDSLKKAITRIKTIFK